MKEPNQISANRFTSSIIVGCLILTSLATLTNAQVRPVYDYGAVGFGQLLRRLRTTASVMMIGAHPDDEDSALLAYLARGESARTAYLSLTRGDGGQNIIGPELFEALGIIRTEELLQARRLDGAEQYFTRAYDYGFSKTLDEAKEKWPEQIIKCDVVRAIRLFKPLVVISRFSGTPADGHGQHQYAGYISPIAVKAAGDASQCKDAGMAWQVQKFYVEQGFGDNSQPTLRVNTGKFDPLLGRTYFEIAMEGRSQHKSQGEGRLELRGDQYSGLRLVDSRIAPSAKPETGVFDGLDVHRTFVLDESSIDLGRADLVSELVSTVTSGGLGDPSELIPEVTKAVRTASGMQIDALAERETVVPGEKLGVSVRVYFNGLQNASVKDISWLSPEGWQITKSELPTVNTAAFNRRENADFTGYYTINVPASAEPTAPYWLERNRRGDIFEWPNDDRQTLPFEPPVLTARVRVGFGDRQMTFDQPVQYRFADAVRGEIRRDLNVVPVVTVAVDRDMLIVPLAERNARRRVIVTITNDGSSSVSGRVAVTASNFTTVGALIPKPVDIELKTRGDSVTIPFDIPLGTGGSPVEIPINVAMSVGDDRYDQRMRLVAYPHIQTHRFYDRSMIRLIRIDLKTAPVDIGYILGSGDEVPDAIRQIGMKVTMIEDIASADLSKFDSIVVGIRASEVRTDLAANNQKLLEYVKNGGNLIVQYQRPTFIQQNLVPFPASMSDTQRTAAGSTSRVVDENAKVTILQPRHPVFNFPNKITDSDFEGWIQERNLYNFVTFDPQFTPLLESHDVGEQPNNGGLVIASIGKGTYIYTSYSWFRQLPAGVPGAYRLFANLLSLPRAVKRND